MLPAFIAEAAEIIEGPAPLLFTCEHASPRVPSPLEPTADDSAILETHWGWDIGASALTRALVGRLGASAVLSRFSRLVCDANRALDDPTWIMGQVEGHRIAFNRRVDPAERLRRLQTYHAPYHSAVDAALGVMGPQTVLIAIHSFTPVYIQEVREMKVGVLYDDCEDAAFAVRDAIASEIPETTLNAPYSGLDGAMYSATRHGRGHDLTYLELELRQDLLATPDGIQLTADRLASALRQAGLARP